MRSIGRRLRSTFGIGSSRMAIRSQMAWYWRWLANLLMMVGVAAVDLEVSGTLKLNKTSVADGPRIDWTLTQEVPVVRMDEFPGVDFNKTLTAPLRSRIAVWPRPSRRSGCGAQNSPSHRL